MLIVAHLFFRAIGIRCFLSWKATKEKAAEPPPFPLGPSDYSICTIYSHKRMYLVSMALLLW